ANAGGASAYARGGDGRGERQVPRRLRCRVVFQPRVQEVLRGAANPGCDAPAGDGASKSRPRRRITGPSSIGGDIRDSGRYDQGRRPDLPDEAPPLNNDVTFARLLAEPNIRRLWITQLCSSGGESLSQIAMPLLVYSLTGSARMVGLMALIIILPRVVLAPITGMLADRLDRRRLIIGADVARLILVSLVPLTESFWQLSILAVLIAAGNATGRPAELAAVPSVAGPQRLVAT